MIVRKPYAFLIKHFRLIHGLLFAMLVFLIIKSVSIYTFFNDYATRHYFTNTNSLVSDYVTMLMFVVTLLVIVVCAIIYYLLSIKQKSRSIYFIIGAYAIIMFGYYVYISNVLSELMQKSMSVESIRAIRDISIIVILPMLVFMFIILSRSLGFNLKKFEFKKDLEDLKIESTDNEEVEVTLGKNNYKYKRFIMKSIRYTGYFIQENKFFVTAVLSIIMLSISIMIYLNIKVYNVKYETNQTIFANTMWYRVNTSYVTQKDISGKEIDENKYYIIVNVNIDNKSNNKYDVSRELFRLEAGGKSIIPIFNMDKEFADFGKIYKATTIDAGDQVDVNVIFEIDKKDYKEEYIFKVNNIENVKATGNSEQYKDIIIKPINIDETIEGSNYYLFSDISFTDTILKNTKLKINEYTVTNNAKDTYLYCLKDKCYDKTFIVKPSNSDKYSILKINTEYTVDSEISMAKKIKNVSDLFEYFGTIKYRYLGNSYTIDVKKVAVEYEKPNIAYFEVPLELAEANKIEIFLSIRGKIVTIVLK